MIAPFDPVTQEEIDWAADYVRSHDLKEIRLVPWGEGVLSFSERKRLLAAACGPYRRLRAGGEITRLDQIVRNDEAAESEKKVRHGNFFLVPRRERILLNQDGLYYRQICRHMCNAHRYKHSLGVAETAAYLASVHHLDEIEAYKAGLLHDVTKNLPDEENEKIIRAYKPEWLDMSPKVWHSYTAVVWCRKNLDLHDSRILHAIAHHTIGDGTGDLDCILYIADKIEPGRGYDTTRQMAAACENLQKAAEMIRGESRRYILEKEGVHV